MYKGRLRPAVEGSSGDSYGKKSTLQRFGLARGRGVVYPFAAVRVRVAAVRGAIRRIEESPDITRQRVL